MSLPAQWTSVATVEGTNLTSVLTVTVPDPLRWAVLTLEGIRVYACSELPATNRTTFTDIQLTVGGQLVQPQVGFGREWNGMGWKDWTVWKGRRARAEGEGGRQRCYRCTR